LFDACSISSLPKIGEMILSVFTPSYDSSKMSDGLYCGLSLPDALCRAGLELLGFDLGFIAANEVFA
jgi:hypothetical protein